MRQPRFSLHKKKFTPVLTKVLDYVYSQKIDVFCTVNHLNWIQTRWASLCRKFSKNFILKFFFQKFSKKISNFDQKSFKMLENQPSSARWVLIQSGWFPVQKTSFWCGETKKQHLVNGSTLFVDPTCWKNSQNQTIFPTMLGQHYVLTCCPSVDQSSRLCLST